MVYVLSVIVGEAVCNCNYTVRDTVRIRNGPHPHFPTYFSLKADTPWTAESLSIYRWFVINFIYYLARHILAKFRIPSCVVSTFVVLFHTSPFYHCKLTKNPLLVLNWCTRLTTLTPFVRRVLLFARVRFHTPPLPRHEPSVLVLLGVFS